MKFLKKGYYLFLILIICFCISEILLRIIIPKPFRIMSGDVVLPSNQTYKIKNDINPYLDRIIIHTVNSLGFRGPEISDSESIRVVTVGGSGVNCLYLNDKQEWSNVLYQLFKKDNKKIWVNNAGYSGNTTFGNILLTENYLVKLKPNYLLFYIGINDLLINQMSGDDKYLLLSTKGFKKIAYHSRLLMMLENFYTTKLFKYSSVNTKEKCIDYKMLKEKNSDFHLQLEIDDKMNLSLLGYATRIKKLIDICNKNKITPIFITHASLFTCGYDSKHQINLGKKVNSDVSVCQVAKMIEQYNHSLIQVCKQLNVQYIDMEKLMPKKIEYYTNFVHFTPEGSNAFASFLYDNLKDKIK